MMQDGEDDDNDGCVRFDYQAYCQGFREALSSREQMLRRRARGDLTHKKF